MSLPRIIWHGTAATGDDLTLVEQELRELLDDGLSRPADLAFHSVWLDDDPYGRTVTCWGKRGSPCFHAEMFDGAENENLLV